MNVMLDEGAVMPTYAHQYDAGLDLFSKFTEEPVTIPAGDCREFDTGVHLQIPQHFCGLVKSRSSMLKKRILTDGLVDADYIGSITVFLYNLGKFPYTVMPGDKIAQLVVSPCLRPPLNLVDEMEQTERGACGFGSTGR